MYTERQKDCTLQQVVYPNMGSQETIMSWYKASYIWFTGNTDEHMKSAQDKSDSTKQELYACPMRRVPPVPNRILYLCTGLTGGGCPLLFKPYDFWGWQVWIIIVCKSELWLYVGLVMICDECAIVFMVVDVVWCSLYLLITLIKLILYCNYCLFQSR